MKYIITVLLVGILISCKENPNTKKESTGNNNIILDSLTMELNEIYKSGNINGFGVAIVNQNGTLYQRGFGLSDIKDHKPYTVSTVQNIASISKTFLGVALLKAQEQGVLNLDDPINKYLPFRVINPHYPDHPITIRHLATHTSSIYDTDDYSSRSYVLKDPAGLSTPPELESLDFLGPEFNMPMNVFLENYLSAEGLLYQKKAFIDRQPGEVNVYSNVGATLAAYVLEQATRESYKDFTQKYILTPLNMANSGWSFEDINMDLHTKLYHNSQTELPFYKLITYPDGGLLTSVEDLSKYLSELIRGYLGKGKLLSKKSYQELYKPQLAADITVGDEEFNFGIFMVLQTDRGEVFHNGGDPGVETYMLFNRNTKIGRILLVNTDFEDQSVEQFENIWNKLGAYTDLLYEVSR